MAGDPGNLKQHPDQSCCGVVQEAKFTARQRNAERTKPQPWIVLKLTVAIASGIIGYTGYVYIGRLCVPMIKRSPSALGGRSMGIGFLVVFCVLILMTAWAYVKALFTEPGDARKLVPQTPRPAPDRPVTPRESWESSEIGGTAYELMSPRVDLSRHASGDRTRTTTPSNDPALGNRLSPNPQLKSTVSEAPIKRPHPSSRTHSANPSGESRPSCNAPTVSGGSDTNAGMTDAISPMHPPVSRMTPSTNARTTTPGDFDLPPPFLSRRPPTTPILLPEYRYCSKCELIKPYRTHHCRACGTCVLKYDHHCPWIGQCVGARNHKFFFIFVEWTCIFCLWTFATLLGSIVRASSDINFDLDPQEVVIVAFGGLFGLFTTTLLASHIMLIMKNQTTVESLNAQSMKERERATLGQMYPWYKFGAKMRTKNRWDEEWGRIGAEGNVWWLGSDKANWELTRGYILFRTSSADWPQPRRRLVLPDKPTI